MDGARAARRDSTRNRQALLDAARDLVTEGHPVTLAAVATRAELTRVTVYRHFADRDDLLSSLVAREAAVIVPPLVEALTGPPLDVAVRAFATDVVRLAHQHRTVLDATADRFGALVVGAVPEEPLVAELARRRATGELGSPLSDDWLAACIIAVGLHAVFDTRPVDDVAADLAESILRLVQ